HYVSLSTYHHPRDLPSFPTRRSSDLRQRPRQAARVHGPHRQQRHLRQGPPSGVADAGTEGPRRSREVEVLQHEGGHLLAERSSRDRKSTRLNSSHVAISYAVFCLKKK